MSVNEMILIIAGLLTMLMVISVLMNPFSRWKREEETTDGAEQASLPPITILLTPHENAPELHRQLPTLLEQVYPGDFKIVLVMEKGDAATEDLVNSYESNPHLYATFIPQSSRYMSRKKLAITLGIKAAQTEWVLLTEPDCLPATNQWLKRMASGCQESCHLVLGYSQLDPTTGDSKKFQRLYSDYYLFREAAKGYVYHTNSTNIIIRKSEFLRMNGFLGNLDKIRGEYDFLVNSLAQRNGTALVTHEDAWMTEASPSQKTWKNKQMFYQETRKHLHRSLRHRLLFNLDQTLLHLNYLALLATLIASLLLRWWLLMGLSIVLLVATCALRILPIRQGIRAFKADIPSWKLIPLEWSLLFRRLIIKWQYLRSDKYNFTTHKV